MTSISYSTKQRREIVRRLRLIADELASGRLPVDTFEVTKTLEAVVSANESMSVLREITPSGNEILDIRIVYKNKSGKWMRRVADKLEHKINE